MVFNTLLIGALTRETIINAKDQSFIDFPGGEILYTAYAIKLAGGSAGLIAKVGEDYPAEWIQEISNKGFNTEGIVRVTEDIEQRRFYRILDPEQISSENPQKYFSEINQPFPKPLLGYSSFKENPIIKKQISPISITPADIPNLFKSTHNIYLSAIDYPTLSLLPAYFRTFANPNIFIKLNKCFMKPTFFSELSSLIQSTHIIFTYEEDLKNLTIGRDKNAWEAAELISGFGVDIVIFQSSKNGICMYIHDHNSRLNIPLHPTEWVDPIGTFDAFIGGFLGKYTKCFDPISAAAMGSAIMSIKAQGTTPEFLLGTMPELAQARTQKVLENISMS